MCCRVVLVLNSLSGRWKMSCSWGTNLPLALRLSRCASPEDVLVAGEGVDAVGSRQIVAARLTIEPQHGPEEAADGPHVGQSVEHMEREATLAVTDIEHQAPGLLSAKVPGQSVGFTYHCDLLRLGVLHEEPPPHDDRTCPEIAVYPQGAHHRRPQFVGPHALRQFTFGLYHRGPPARAAPVKCLIKKIQFFHIFFASIILLLFCCKDTSSTAHLVTVFYCRYKLPFFDFMKGSVPACSNVMSASLALASSSPLMAS